jgi:hypothetical protein
MTAQAVPIIIRVSGKVASSGDGAILVATSPPAKTIIGADDIASGCAKNKSQIFFGKFMKCRPNIEIVTRPISVIKRVVVIKKYYLDNVSYLSTKKETSSLLLIVLPKYLSWFLFF